MGKWYGELDTVLLSRCFKWRTVLYRKPSLSYFTVLDYKESTDKAISLLPDNLEIKEVYLKSEFGQISDELIELQTTIYWKE